MTNKVILGIGAYEFFIATDDAIAIADTLRAAKTVHRDYSKPSAYLTAESADIIIKFLPAEATVYGNSEC